MAVATELFLAGNVYIDFPYEEVFFRFEKLTGKVFRRFYGDAFETQVAHDSKLYAEACCAGNAVSEQDYWQGRGSGAAP